MSKLTDIMVKDGHLGGYIPGGDAGTWCPHLWNWAISKFGVRSMLDVGCGEGHSARFFQKAGCEIKGVEGCATAIKNSAIPQAVVQHDFTHGPFDPGRTFDLVWSCEFLEHVEHRYVPNILAAFARAAKVLLVTHAFPHQTDGYHHVNCRPTSYWLRQIEPLGFECDVLLTREARTVTLRDYPSINHFARSGLVFVKRDAARGVLPEGMSASLKAWQINWGFRLSSAYREQVRQRRKAKHAARKAA